MKRKTLLAIIFILIYTNILSAQSLSEKYPANKKFYKAVDKWIMLPKPKVDSSYIYGFIYIDTQAGFTFQLEGEIIVGQDGTFTSNNTSKERMVKIRIPKNWALVATIPSDKLEQLNLPEQPKWLNAYKSGEGNIAYLVRIGFHYNSVGASELALDFLNEAYIIDPHYKGLEFELSFAYNATLQFDKAITVSENAIKHNPNDFFFYRELGYALAYSGRTNEAEATYRKGIEICDNNRQKSEMSFNMTQAFSLQRNKDKFEEWYSITKGYTEKDSEINKILDILKERMQETQN